MSAEALPLEGKSILLGVSGSIAAYKAADLCSRLVKLGVDIHVVQTPAAMQFVGPATFRALTRNAVITDLFDEPNGKRIAHIDLAQSADLVLVAPASADVLARMAHGMADDMLTTCLLATPVTTPLLVAPAMNTVMWEHPATVSNLDTLRERGAEVIEPGYGLLACQDVGTGKLADVEAIVWAVRKRLQAEQDYAGLCLLVTAGATREPLDPVRFLSNRSSGKMGYALAQAAQTRGAQVILVSGFTTVPPPNGVELIRVSTAEEMRNACAARFPQCHGFIGAAAVADYAPAEVAMQKIKKANIPAEEDVVTLTLRRTPHVLAQIAASKQAGQVVVGFAAETQDLLANARSKPYAGQLDLIVANDVASHGSGFDGDTNQVTLIKPDGAAEQLPLMSKQEVAHQVLNRIRPAFQQRMA